MRRVLLAVLLLVAAVSSAWAQGQPPAPAYPLFTGTAAAGTGVTATVTPTSSADFVHVTYVEITMCAAALLTAAATPVVITTTGFSQTGVINPSFSMDAAATAQGVCINRLYSFVGQPLRSSTRGAAITVVAPATTNVIWRISVYGLFTG